MGGAYHGSESDRARSISGMGPDYNWCSVCGRQDNDDASLLLDHAIASRKFIDELLEGLMPLLPRTTVRSAEGIIDAVKVLVLHQRTLPEKDWRYRCPECSKLTREITRPICDHCGTNGVGR